MLILMLKPLKLKSGHVYIIYTFKRRNWTTICLGMWKSLTGRVGFSNRSDWLLWRWWKWNWIGWGHTRIVPFLNLNTCKINIWEHRNLGWILYLKTNNTCYLVFVIFQFFGTNIESWYEQIEGCNNFYVEAT